MSKAADIDPDDEDLKETIAEMARSDRDSAPVYRAFYEETYGEEVPSE